MKASMLDWYSRLSLVEFININLFIFAEDVDQKALGIIQ